MPCCQSVLSAAAAAAAAASSTPSWLHRLHAKEGLSFPTHLHIDDLLYGGRQQPPLSLPPPPPSSSNPHASPAAAKEAHPKPGRPKQQQQRPPRNPPRPNPSSHKPPRQPPPPLQLSAVVSEVFAVPSSAPPDALPLKAFRKQSRPRPTAEDQQQLALPPPPRPRKEKKDKVAKAKRRRLAERAGVADGERSTRTDVTVIDTSTDGWKAAKVLIRRGGAWKVRDKKPSAAPDQEDALAKGKRRAGLVSKLLRDKEKEKLKEKEGTSSGNILAAIEEVAKEADASILTLKRS
ncbi:hypothetical protein ACP4OV_012751 [Aristida adscensionis]